MAVFVPGRSVTTQVPLVQVDAGLDAGVHRFQLVVVDDTGARSEPAVIEVRVRPRTIGPVPVGPIGGGIVVPR